MDKSDVEVNQMKLYICEKPSLAAAVAENLGKPVKKNGYFEVDGDCVAWLHGHIMGLKMPEDYDLAWKRYRLETLPLIPVTWEKKVLKRDIYKNIKDLLKKADSVVHVGDPDREGQLLVDEVLESCGNKLPTMRLFVNAMDRTTVQRALASMEDNRSDKNRNMYLAALARQYTDWLYGINASRKYSIESKQTVKVGRVKVPMLALVARRNELIDSFESVISYGVKAFFRTGKSLPFLAVWEIPKDIDGLDEEGRLLDAVPARECLEKITGMPGKVVSIEKKKLKNSPPLPFSLSTLQRAAGPAFGFSPSRTLKLAQALYEKKLTTYPRSDSNHLPESQYADAANILSNMAVTGSDKLRDWAKGADKTLKSGAYNSKKVDAHHAIIPTLEKVDLLKLPDDERKLYEMIAKRFILQFYPNHEYEQTIVGIDCAGEKFVAKGKRVIVEGWKKIEKPAKDDAEDKDESKELPPMHKGDELLFVNANLSESESTPPARFTQDTLIGALTNAHKYVLDKNLKDVVKEIKGIGTEATRSSILDELLKAGMLYEKANGKKKKELYVNEMVKELLKCLPDELTYPDKTALMELELDKIAKGNLKLDDYLQEQYEYIRELIAVKTEIEQPKIICPECQAGELKLRHGKFGDFWGCSRYKEGCAATYKNVNGRPLIVNVTATADKDITCPICGDGKLQLKTSKNGAFWGCSRYKEGCRAIFSDVNGEPFIKECPKCKKGHILKKKGHKGPFYACNQYPACDAIFRVGKNGLPSINQGNKQ